MNDERLWSILVCPENRQPLRRAEPGVVAALNGKIEAGRLKNRAGAEIKLPLEQGLVRADGKVLYPIRQGIPVLLIAEAIELEGT